MKANVFDVQKYSHDILSSESKVIGINTKKINRTKRLIVIAIEFEMTAYLLVKICLPVGFSSGTFAA
jgi:hypothetical protein